MAKINTRGARPQTYSPVTSEQTPSGHTYEGGPGFARNVRSELFLYAVSRFSGESSFYEDAKAGDARYVNLIHAATAEDPTWVANFLKWLRTDANMRTAAIVGAAEYVKARTDEKAPTGRKVVDSVILRADEPGEMVAYWTTTYGMSIPNPVKRGVGDALLRLGTERNYLRYGNSGGFTWDRLLNLVHPGEDKHSNQRPVAARSIRAHYQVQVRTRRGDPGVAARAACSASAEPAVRG
jgi:hypothetical protein